MNYRLAVETDLPQLAVLRWEFRTELYPPAEGFPTPAGDQSLAGFLPVCLAFLQDALASGGWAFWIAEQEGQIVANLCIQRIPKIPRPGRLKCEFAYITNVYTRPAWRNQGVGAELMKRAQEWGLREGLEFFILWPSKRSGAFYRRAGFIPSPEALEYHFEE